MVSENMRAEQEFSIGAGLATNQRRTASSPSQSGALQSPTLDVRIPVARRNDIKHEIAGLPGDVDKLRTGPFRVCPLHKCELVSDLHSDTVPRREPVVGSVYKQDSNSIR